MKAFKDLRTNEEILEYCVAKVLPVKLFTEMMKFFTEEDDCVRYTKAIQRMFNNEGINEKFKLNTFKEIVGGISIDTSAKVFEFKYNSESKRMKVTSKVLHTEKEQEVEKPKVKKTLPPKEVVAPADEVEIEMVKEEPIKVTKEKVTKEPKVAKKVEPKEVQEEKKEKSCKSFKLKMFGCTVFEWELK